MKLWVLVGLQNKATNAVSQAETLFNDAVDNLTAIANEIVAAYPQYFSNYIDGMGCQNFYWEPGLRSNMVGDDAAFDPDDNEARWGYEVYEANGNDTRFVPFPDELIEAFRIYRRVQTELHRLDSNNYG